MIVRTGIMWPPEIIGSLVLLAEAVFSDYLLSRRKSILFAGIPMPAVVEKVFVGGFTLFVPTAISIGQGLAFTDPLLAFWWFGAAEVSAVIAVLFWDEFLKLQGMWRAMALVTSILVVLVCGRQADAWVARKTEESASELLAQVAAESKALGIARAAPGSPGKPKSGTADTVTAQPNDATAMAGPRRRFVDTSSDDFADIAANFFKEMSLWAESRKETLHAPAAFNQWSNDNAEEFRASYSVTCDIIFSEMVARKVAREADFEDERAMLCRMFPYRERDLTYIQRAADRLVIIAGKMKTQK